MAKHETLKEIERAEKALAASKAKHREAFRKAITQVYEEFGLALEPSGPGGLEIVAFEGSAELPK